MGFQDILGHERQIALLTSAIRRDKVHHAYLFSGPAGIGRTTIALTFARALNCDRHDGDACEVCPSCHKILAGTHPDLQIVGQDRNEAEIKIADVRDKILRFVSYKVFEGRFRVILILGAERMNSSTANALLKTLEEPPPKTVFILTVANLNTLLPTIRSRCSKIRFSPVEEEKLAGFLEQRHRMAPDQTRLLARLAEGSVGRALSLTEEQLMARASFLTALTRVGTGGKFDPVAMAEQLAGEKAQLQAQLEVFETFLRDTAVRHQAPSAPLRNPDQADAIDELAARVSFTHLQRLMALLREARGAIRLNIKPQPILERLFLELAQVQRAHHGTAGPRH
jgi:DNA polymerase-3 subunit delta'